MTIYFGTIITLDKDNNIFKYLVEDKGRILYVGNSIPEAFKEAEVVELGERVLLPSFCDSHQHFASFAMFNMGLNVMNLESNAEIKEAIKKFAEKSKDKMIIAFGASKYAVKERALLTKADLDEVCPNKPIAVVKYDGHAAIVNSALIKKIYQKAYNLRGFHEDTGEMNQEAFFMVSNFMSSSISIFKLIKAMRKAVDYEISKGIGMVHSVSGVGFPLNLDITLETLFSKSLKNGFQIRVFPQALDIKVAKRRKLKRIGGCFKCALDGCFGSVDAALNGKYLDGSDGVLYYSNDLVIDFCKKANRAGLQIEMHAIGDKAFDQATRALKAALDDFPRKDHRHGIIHACLPTEEGLKICQDYNIQLPVQSAFIDWKQEPDEYLKTILDKKTIKRLNPLKKFVDLGLVISAGSDGPCTDPDPIIWFQKAVEAGLTVDEALRICSYNGYWTTFDEKDRGSLEVGKIADMVILSKDPHKTLDIKVEETILKGKRHEF